jgi:SAM-dependent MidA family methyltransferase
VNLTERLAALVRATGPIRFSEFMERALYDDDGGFYATGGVAGRRGDFLTSPEVGPLFGAVLARAIDTWWRDAGQPASFTVVDAGAGPGTLARTVLAAQPAVLAAGALRYVTVERADAQRADHPAGVQALADLPDEPFVGVIVANELLDNVAFDVAVFDGGWRCAHVDERDGRLVEVLAPLPADLAPLAALLPPSASHGARAPLAIGAVRWLREARSLVTQGRVVVVDYGADTATLVGRPWRQWLRTFRGHARGQHPLLEVGTQDITADVPFDQLATVAAPDTVRNQTAFLAAHGIGDLVEEGKRIWTERAHLGDLAALKARSRLRESDALTDPEGLGGFTVAEWLRV